MDSILSIEVSLESGNLLAKARERSAAITSVCSDIPEYVWFRGELSSMTAIASLYALPLAVKGGRTYFYKKKWLEHLAYHAFRNTYQGKWSIVQEILEQYDDSLYSIEKVLDKYFSVQDFFGNIVPLTQNMLENRVYYKEIYHSVKDDNRHVNYPSRKRGYTDKGYRRPTHSWLPREIHPSRVESRPDRRSQIGNPPPYYWFGSEE